MRMDEVYPVKLFAAILFSSAEDLKAGIARLEASFGPTDYISPETPFDVTDYYAEELGTPIYRALVSFQNAVMPSFLPDIKLKTISIEDAMRKENKRTINVDSGYMDFDKVVLASTKKGPYKIYMSRGIWADMTLHYEKGNFLPFAWTFADFKDGRYNKYLLRIRELFKKASHNTAPQSNQ